ncbi:hypothetical protein B0T11DRAFT_130268 [Plectosphaerella cucumerina]|uniref:Secreted protein n=1 Tax=Plectosphaerella cucumerina TaxID=40658 RepID=A0A8K0TBC0_9PEZI|nr:hypothetical protein B0T11DRAFT_130268 [Plectosphaerella cucumerina]
MKHVFQSVLLLNFVMITLPLPKTSDTTHLHTFIFSAILRETKKLTQTSVGQERSILHRHRCYGGGVHASNGKLRASYNSQPPMPLPLDMMTIAYPFNYLTIAKQSFRTRVPARG